jgi:hypothetical protein
MKRLKTLGSPVDWADFMRGHACTFAEREHLRLIAPKAQVPCRRKPRNGLIASRHVAGAPLIA